MSQLILEEKVLVSLDMMSPSANAPVALTATVANDCLKSDESLDDQICLSQDEVCYSSLLDSSINVTYLAYRGRYILHVSRQYGTAMVQIW